MVQLATFPAEFLRLLLHAALHRFGVAFAGIVAGTDSDAPLALVGESHWAVPFAILIFATVIAGLYARLRGWASRPLS